MYTIIMPTMWQSIEYLIKMLNIYCNSKYVNEVIIIDNDPNNVIGIKDNNTNKKIKIVTNNRNLFVNPSWNWGVDLCKTDKIIIANDDIVIEDFEKLIKHIDGFLKPRMVIGPSHTCFVKRINPLLKIVPFKKNILPHIFKNKNGWGWGTFMIMYKNSYKYIPAELLIWRGDIIQQNSNSAYEFSGVYIETKMSTTIKNKNLRNKAFEDKKIFLDYYDQKGNLKNFNID